MIKFTTHKYHLPWICFNHSLKAEAIDATYNKQTSTWTAADQQQSEEIHFLLSLKTLSLILRYFSNSMLPFATVHLWPQPEGCSVMNHSTNQASPFVLPSPKTTLGCLKQATNLLPLPWLSVQWIETGLPEMAFLKQETKTWFTLQNVCVCTHTERDWNGFWLQGVKMKRWDLNWWQLILLSPSVILMCSQHTYSLSYLLGAMCVLGIANIKGQLKCLSPFQSSLQWKIHMDTKKKSRLHLEYCQGITKKMVHFTWKDEKPGLHRSGPKPSLN